MRRSRLFVCALALALAALAGCGGGGDGSSPTTGSGSAAGGSGSDSDTVAWPLFGRVEQRTHYIADAPDPPFHLLWEFFAKQLIEFPPVLEDGFAFVVNKTGELYVVDAETGKTIRQVNLADDVNSPAYADGVIYAAQTNGTLTALEVPGLKPRWRFKAPSELESSPLVVDDRVFIGSDDGTFYALDAASGKVDWQARLGHQVKASPSYDSGTVYVGDYEGTVWALDAERGKRRWSTDTTSLPPGGDGGFYSSPSVAFGRVSEARTDGTIYALDAANGKLAWQFQTSNSILFLRRDAPWSGVL